MRTTLYSIAFLTTVGFMTACGSSSGGGGGGGGASASGGAAGTACNNVSANEGCLGTAPPKRMQCVSGKWAEIMTCAANEHCTETADAGAPGTTKHLSACIANAAQPDVTGGNGGADASDSGTTPDVGGSETLVVDIIGAKDTPTVKPDAGKDVCTPKCSGKVCGPDGCGGTCGACSAGSNCDATGKCVGTAGTITMGASCFGKTTGCVTGAKCEANADLSDWVCQKARNAGQSCGPGIGECVTGTTCNFVDSTLKGMKCYAAASDGAACSTPGFGDCGAGTNCVYTDSQGSSTQCVPSVGPGGTCAVVSLGLCDAGSDCIAQGSGSGYQCMAQAPAGSACGAGVGGCAPGSDCVYDNSAKSSATCQVWGQIGDACADYGTAGSCVTWASCTPDSSATGSAFHCQPFAAAGGACGYNIGLCAPYLQCAFADASQTTMTCLKAGGAGDVCGSGVGGCLSGYACYLAATGDPTGTCKDECLTQNTYNDGTCDTCLNVDPDCLK